MENMQSAQQLLARLVEVAQDHELFTCECGRLAYMVDPGDGLKTHFIVKGDYVVESELE